MWQLREPDPVKLIIGILAADARCLAEATSSIVAEFGDIDLASDVWPFTQTNYYNKELGQNILRQIVSIDKIIDPGQLPEIKHRTNTLEEKLTTQLGLDLPRPVNLDPGIIEPSKLVLASTKNFSHRIYIGNKMFAEVTLIFEKGKWRTLEHTYPDYKQQCYFDYFDKVRKRLLEQLSFK